MALNRPKSPKERRDAKNARSFIGRTEQQDQFQRSLLQPDHGDAKLIFSISGQGGVGKTSLLREFRRIAEEHSHVTAYVDEGVATNRVDDVPEAMHRLAEDLEAQGFKFEKFRERYKAYRVKKQEMEADPEAPKGFVGDATRGVMKIALEAGKTAVPFGSMIDSEMVASKAGELMNYGVERFRNKDEERLIKETLEVLTPLFLEGVKKIPIEKTLVLMLDTYEVTGAFLDEWVRGLLDEDYGVLERSILLCIGGRDPIDRNAWDEWEGVIARSPLEPFTRAEAEAFLASKQIKSVAVIEEIWRLSSDRSGDMGLPLLVSMMAAAAPTSADVVVDPCEDAVNRFLKWETDGGRRDLAQDAACARVLNADVVAALGEGSFEWLRGCAFVLRDGARWRYHLVVREQMLRYLGQKSPKRYGEVHGKLAVYYDGLRNGLRLEAGKEAEDKVWREYSLEWIYHELCAAPQAKLGLALNGFLLALKQSRAFAQAWAEVMVQVGQEAKGETLQKWGGQLRDGLIARDEKRYEVAIPVLTTLLGSSVIEERLKAIVLSFRGAWYGQSDNQELAMQDLLKAVELDENDAECQLYLGFAYQNLQRYEEAIKTYQRAIVLNSCYKEAFVNRGATYHSMECYEEALKDFDRAIEIDNKYSWAIASRSHTFNALKRYEEKLKDLDRAIEIDNKYSWAIASRGETYRTLERYEEALRDFDRAIELEPTAWRLGQRGETYRLMKRYEEALKDFDRAIELDSEYAWAIASRGQTYQLMKRYDDAIVAYQHAITLNPEWADVYNNLGITYKAQKCYDDAIRVYQRAISLNPECAAAYNNLGNTYKAQKRYDNAIIAYQHAITLNPEYAKAFANRGEVYRLTKCYEKALKDFDRAIELNSELDWPIASRGQTYQSLKRYEEALKDFDRAIELEPTAWRFAQRGNTYRLMKRYEEALKDFDRAIELEPTAWKLWKRGQTYLLMKCYEEALKDFDRAIELAPENDWYPYLRALAHLKLNQPEPAETDFQKAIAIATPNYEKDPIDYQNTFNLALYHLAAGHHEESDRLYTSNLSAPIEWLQMAIDDLEEFLQLFPDHTQAQQTKQLLQGAIDAAQPTTL